MKIYQVDAFTDTPFRGNPAGVCVLEAPRPDTWMQGVAAEMNLSETAFVLAEGDHCRLRWFTPSMEVSLCGHATLGSAHVMWETGLVPRDRAIAFHTRSGVLTVRTDGAWIEMDFPIRRVEPTGHVDAVNRALRADPVATSQRLTESGQLTYLVELATEDEVRGLKPDFAALLATDTRGLIVTARATTRGYDFVSRYFAPAVGINEDPVTGSAHCCLAPYWAERLGKTDLLGLQVSARGGVVGCAPRGERVVLRGQAVTAIRGELLA